MRAIDADELWEKMYRYTDNEGAKMPYGDDDSLIHKDSACFLIENAPTIEPERKTGKWQKLYGYFTPGGDPVWCCSECGKGIHVFGIENSSYGKDIADHQWLSCPNCDARMVGEEE